MSKSVFLTQAAVAVASSFVSLAALAQEVDCSRPDLSTVELKFCAQKEYERADRVLNSVYRDVVARAKAFDRDASGTGTLPPKMYEKLVASEKAWITLRDANCGLEATKYWGGTAYGLVLTQCLTKETAQRTDYLLALFND